MSFNEWEFPRKIAFRRSGGQMFNTTVIGVQSGQEQRNQNWAGARRKYMATLLASTDSGLSAFLATIQAVQVFHFLTAGMENSFRFYDELDGQATNEPMVVVPGTSNLQWQLQRTYTLGGVSVTRAITKPIGSPAIDYLGNSLSETVVVSGGTVTSIDHTTGIVTFSPAPGGTPTASFQYHIPVRFLSDEFDPEIEESGPNARLVKWNSLGLIEVFPPNY